MRAHIGTYCAVWSRDDVQPQAAIRKDGRTARGGTSLGSHAEPHRSIPVDILSVKETLAQVEAGKEDTAR